MIAVWKDMLMPLAVLKDLIKSEFKYSPWRFYHSASVQPYETA